MSRASEIYFAKQRSDVIVCDGSFLKLIKFVALVPPGGKVHIVPPSINL